MKEVKKILRKFLHSFNGFATILTMKTERSPEPSAAEAQNLQPAPSSTEGTASATAATAASRGTTPAPKAAGDELAASLPDPLRPRQEMLSTGRPRYDYDAQGRAVFDHVDDEAAEEMIRNIGRGAKSC